MYIVLWKLLKEKFEKVNTFRDNDCLTENESLCKYIYIGNRTTYSLF